MVNAMEPLVCEVCNEGFCEIIEKNGQKPGDMVDEGKIRTND